LVAHFDLPEKEVTMPARRLLSSLNALLPADIRILSAARTCASFHARFGATSKQYRYQVWNAPVMNPLLQGRAWHVTYELDLAAMREAASMLRGRHDFRAFTSRRDGMLAESSRTLKRCDIRRSGTLLTFIIEGDGFLYKMCRGIVGTLVKTGRGQMTRAEVEKLLIHPEKNAGRLNAPAHGLILWKVRYSPRLRDGWMK
jgi:tRNA pseudouridine38-40 synthase